MDFVNENGKAEMGGSFAFVLSSFSGVVCNRTSVDIPPENLANAHVFSETEAGRRLEAG